MKILIDIGHPAHIHYVRNAIEIWQKHGHDIVITARNKKIIQELLKFYHLSYIDRGKGKNSRLGKLFYMLYADLVLFKVSIKHKPDIYLSFSSPYAAQVATLLGKPHIAFNDTEHTDKIHSKFTYPYSKVIITPHSYQNDLGTKQIRYRNINDGLYLHDNYFQPNPLIREELNIKEDEEYAILRFVSWNAHHDFGQSGLDLDTKRKLIEVLQKRFKIFISSEEDLTEEFKPFQINIKPQNMHHALAYASLFVGESGTMASESAFLGTQAVYINSLPLMCYLKEEQEAGLLKHFKSSKGVVEYVTNLIVDKNLKKKSIEKSKEMKDNFIDPTKFLAWFIEEYPTSFKKLGLNSEYQNKFI